MREIKRKFRVVQGQFHFNYFHSQHVAVRYAKEAAQISDLSLIVEKWNATLSKWTAVETIN